MEQKQRLQNNILSGADFIRDFMTKQHVAQCEKLQEAQEGLDKAVVASREAEKEVKQLQRAIKAKDMLEDIDLEGLEELLA